MSGETTDTLARDPDREDLRFMTADQIRERETLNAQNTAPRMAVRAKAARVAQANGATTYGWKRP